MELMKMGYHNPKILGLLCGTIALAINIPAHLENAGQNSISTRRIREPDLAEVFVILAENGRRVSREAYEALLKYVEGEESLIKIIEDFAPSETTYDSERSIESIRGESRGYKVRFLIFHEKNQVRSLAFSITSTREDGPDNVLKDIFIRVPLYRLSPESEFMPGDISYLISSKAFSCSRYGYFEDYPSEEILISMAPISHELDKKNLQQLATDNPIIKFLLTRRKFIASLAMDAFLYCKNRIQNEAGLYLDQMGAIFVRYEYAFFGWRSFSSASTLAHEFIHHIFRNKLYQGEVDDAYGRYAGGNIGAEECLEELKRDTGLEISQKVKEAFLKYISDKKRENMFIYMAKNHAKLTAKIIEAYFLNPVYTAAGADVLEETVAYLFGTFAETHSSGRSIYQVGEADAIEVSVKACDAEIFAELGLIPDWMRPSRLGFGKEYIDKEYYDLLERATPS